MSDFPRPVTLRADEVRIAVDVAVYRMLVVLGRGWQPRYGEGPPSWERHIVGAIGELAVAKLTGTYWAGSGPGCDRTDVGPYCVRATSKTDGPFYLILHDDDPDDAVHFYVSGLPPVLTVHGWIVGKEGKRPEHWGDPLRTKRPAFFVPVSALERGPIP